MRHTFVVAAVLLLNFVLPGSAGVCKTNSKVIFCYYDSWAANRKGIGQLKAVNIYPFVCTHIAYAFLSIDDDAGIVTMNPLLDYGSADNVVDFVALTKRFPGLKVFASVGGSNASSAQFSVMASTEVNRRKFIESVLNFLLGYGFDGLDLDWEYPVQRGGKPDDYNNFPLLLRQLKTALKQQNLLLSVAVAAVKTSAEISYDIPSLSANADFINLMTYAFASRWNDFLDFNFPLTGRGPNTVEASVNYWLEHGAPANKLLLGIPLYGRTFKLASKLETEFGAQSAGVGTEGPFSRSAGILSYYEICANFLDGGWHLKWNGEHSAPYAYNRYHWVTYENTKSIDKKLEFVGRLKLRGVMVWSLDHSDIVGLCSPNNTKYSLLKHIRRAAYIPSQILPRREVAMEESAEEAID